MDTTLRTTFFAYLGAQRRFHDTLKAWNQCRRNCRFGGRWPKMTRDARKRYHEAAIVLRAAQMRYRETKQLSSYI